MKRPAIVKTALLLCLSGQVLPIFGEKEGHEWRNDAENIRIVRELNRVYERVPFSTEYEGVLDDCPFRLDWTVGPDLPRFWKGGISGTFGDEIILARGAWEDNQSRAYSYNIATQSYSPIAAPPVATSFAQGASDGRYIYLIGGKSAGRQATRLSRSANGTWTWSGLPPVPEKNRWTAAVNVVGNWLFLYSGRLKEDNAVIGSTGESAAEPVTGKLDPLKPPDWRLRLDLPNPKWEPMAPYPGRACSVVNSAVARGKIYVFGGYHDDNVLKSTVIELDLWKKHRLRFFAPSTVVNYRDAFRYDPAADRWEPIRRLPFSMNGAKGIVVQDRYILLMGIANKHTLRVGRSDPSHGQYMHQYWKGYGDVVLCYDIEKDNYSRVGLMLYGVSTWAWERLGDRIYGFGGEPSHSLHSNRDNVLQIATIRPGH